jgi:hypothetical protein
MHGFGLRDVFRFSRRDLPQRSLPSHTYIGAVLRGAVAFRSHKIDGRLTTQQCRLCNGLWLMVRLQTVRPPVWRFPSMEMVAAPEPGPVLQSSWAPAFAAPGLAQLASRLVRAGLVPAGPLQRSALAEGRKPIAPHLPCIVQRRLFRSRRGPACRPCRRAIRRCSLLRFSSRWRSPAEVRVAAWPLGLAADAAAVGSAPPSPSVTSFALSGQDGDRFAAQFKF